MKLCFYVLLLPIWANNCLNTNKSDITPTTGGKNLESMETKRDNSMRDPLTNIIGFMIMAIFFSCTFFWHYCYICNATHKAETMKKKNTAAETSNMPVSESKTGGWCGPEKQPMLSTIDKLSGPSSPEKSPIPSSAEKSIRPSNSKQLFRSSQLEKPCRPHGLKKPYKLARAHKPVSLVSSSYPVQPVRPLWSASHQYPARPSKPLCPPCPQNQILPPKPSHLQKLAKPPKQHNLKRSVSIGRAVMLSSPDELTKSCQYYEERCRFCKTFSVPLVHDISEAKKKTARNLPVSSEVKSFCRSCHKLDSRDTAYSNNVSDNVMAYASNDDSDTKLTIICNIRNTDVILEGAPNN
ncbi:PREDICTED: uncharacterized protein CXorf66 homolog [Galeopterus variegatus]|uniref:Uncharacterized protein CXorf66 homolog n=1 Tax=Galeopterus variegatus TaxID=482537 RepID=A0ABM0QYH8_GALVR|nr:PREDICTED: uncharacterized protein CXorf66 homolog [Galeopterus variegatus]